jgi:ParB-like chromosome segregation protein Spo0J
MKQRLSINKIKPNAVNPRYIKDHKFKKLVKSIKSFPEMLEKRPIIVDENMIVLGGNMRLKASIEAGLKEVWIDIAEGWSEDQKKEFIIKDNVGFGEWDWDILGNEWNVKQLEDWGLDGFPFEEEQAEIKDISDSIESSFRVEVELENEEEQEKLYNELINKGYICRLLTL